MSKIENPWTAEMIAKDYHGGSRYEAAVIADENGYDAPLACGCCGGDAYYKHTIGTEKCVNCGAINLRGEWERTGFRK